MLGTAFRLSPRAPEMPHRDAVAVGTPGGGCALCRGAPSKTLPAWRGIAVGASEQANYCPDCCNCITSKGLSDSHINRLGSERNQANDPQASVGSTFLKARCARSSNAVPKKHWFSGKLDFRTYDNNASLRASVTNGNQDSPNANVAQAMTATGLADPPTIPLSTPGSTSTQPMASRSTPTSPSTARQAPTTRSRSMLTPST